MQQVAAGTAGSYQAPPNLTIYNYNASVPESLQWNAGGQFLLPWDTQFDASWVGIYNYNIIAYGTLGVTTGQNPMDENAPDLGTAYLAKYQDPTLGTSSVPGATAVNTNLMRPYRGIGSITASWPYAWTRYDTLQFSFSHPTRKGFTIGGNYVLGLRNVGNLLSEPHFQHNSDGSFQWSPLQDQINSVLRDVGTRRNTVKIYTVYQVPTILQGNKVASYLASHWQVSANFQGGTGIAYDAVYGYNTAGGNVNITGSYNYNGRIKITGDPGSGCTGNRYAEINTAAYQGPGYGSIGNESGSYLLRGCPDHQLAMSLSRYFFIGKSETKRLQLRADAYNVFNNIIFNAYSNTMTMASPATNTTIANNQYMSDGTLNPARLTPATAGFGAATGAMATRLIQLQARFYF